MQYSDIGQFQTILGSECIGDSLPKINSNMLAASGTSTKLLTDIKAVSGAVQAVKDSNTALINDFYTLDNEMGVLNVALANANEYATTNVTQLNTDITNIRTNITTFSALSSYVDVGGSEIYANRGYCNLPGGLFMQWGVLSGVAITTTNPLSVRFAYSYKDRVNVFNVTTTRVVPLSTASNTTVTPGVIRNISAQGFELISNVNNPNGSEMWMALGYRPTGPN